MDFRKLTYMSPGLADIVEQLLEPAPEDRFQVIGLIVCMCGTVVAYISCNQL